MKNTIDLITTSICIFIRFAFPPQHKLYNAEIQTIKMLLVRSKDAIHSYSTMINRLTKIDFGLRKYDPWKILEGYENAKVNELLYRMESLYSIFAICAEVKSILPRDDFDLFKRLNPFKVCSPLILLTLYLYMILISFCSHIC